MTKTGKDFIIIRTVLCIRRRSTLLYRSRARPPCRNARRISRGDEEFFRQERRCSFHGRDPVRRRQKKGVHDARVQDPKRRGRTGVLSKIQSECGKCFWRRIGKRNQGRTRRVFRRRIPSHRKGRRPCQPGRQ